MRRGAPSLVRPAALARAAALASLLSLLIATAADAGAFRLVFVGEGVSDDVETVDVDGTLYFRLSDLGRATGAIRHWNPVTGKATLRIGERLVTVSADNPFARCDGGIRNLRHPVLRDGDGFWVPPAYLTEVLAWALDADVSYDAGAGEVTVARHRVTVATASVEGGSGGTVLVLGLSGQAQFSADDAGDALEILVRGAGLSDSLIVPDGAGLITGVTVERVRKGVLVTAHLSDRAGGYGTEIETNPDRIEIAVEPGAPGAVRSAMLGAPGERIVNAHAIDRVFDTIVVDPGHGGTDVGARGASGVAEKDLNLAFAQELGRALEREGFLVLFTRQNDETVPLKRRAETANLAEADLFVSIHSNAWFSEGAEGVQVSHRAPSPRTLARGRPRRARGATPGTARWEDVQDPYVPESRLLADAIHDRIAAATPWATRSTRAGDFPVLSGASMPAIMVEIGFVTNPEDAGRLGSETWRRELARSIAKGVSDFRANMTGRRV